jgi:hypothetical protein
MHTYICICICMHMYTHTSMHTYICICICKHRVKYLCCRYARVPTCKIIDGRFPFFQRFCSRKPFLGPQLLCKWYTHTYIHTCIHVHTHICLTLTFEEDILRRDCQCIFTVFIRAHTHTHTHTRTFMCAHTHSGTCLCLCMHCV